MRAVLIICDVWDTLPCKQAATRVTTLASRINAFARKRRNAGALVIHAPSHTMPYYAGSAGRELARVASTIKAPIQFGIRREIPGRESPIPVPCEDGCDPPCPRAIKPPWPWAKQHDAIAIEPGDAVSDSGQEIWNLMEARGLNRVILVGVHLNGCILSRPFGVRQMVMAGRDVVVVRDLTDCFYRGDLTPEEAVDLTAAHIEKFWCPTVLSKDLQ